MFKESKQKLPCSQCPSFKKSIFCLLRDDKIQSLANRKAMISFRPRQSVFVQGSPAMGIYCVQEGLIKIYKTDNYGNETITRLVRAGETLGHQLLLEGGLHTTTASCLNDTKVCFLPIDVVNNLLTEDSELSVALLKRVMNDSEKTEEKLVSFARKNVREKLAELLLSLKDTEGYKIGNDWKLDIKLSRAEIAAMMGVTIESSIRFISELKAENIIRQEGKTIYITDVEKLEFFSGKVA